MRGAETTDGQNSAKHGAQAVVSTPENSRTGTPLYSLLEHLRDRKVIQWVVGYAGIAWLIAQGLSLATEAFSWPIALLRLALIILVFGVPAALIIAWNHGAKGWHAPPRSEVILLFLIALTAIGVASATLRERGGLANSTDAPNRPASRAAAANSVAVLPFVNMGPGTDTDYFSDGMTEELINTLGRVDGLRVAARSSAFQFKGKVTDSREVGQRLGVASIIEGSVRKSDDRLRISIELVDAKGGHQIWANTYDREMTDVFAVQEEIAQAVVAALKIKLSGNAARLVAKHTQNLEAYQSYLRGRFFWNKRDGPGLTKALQYFGQAVEYDPAYALAYAGLADTYLLLPLHTSMSTREAFPRAKAAAQRAVEMNEQLAEGHTSLAYVLFWNDWDYPAAEREFRRAIELNPNYPTAHHWYSEFLVTSGRIAESKKSAARAEELDPLSPIISTDAAANFYFAREYDAAIRRLRRVLELDPKFLVARWYLGKSYGQQGKHAEAISELRKAARDSPTSDWSMAYLGYEYAQAGDKSAAEAILIRLNRDAKTRYVRPDILALLNLAVGRKDAALSLLERAVAERAVYPFIMAGDPQLDRLRSEARFRALLDHMKIPLRHRR